MGMTPGLKRELGEARGLCRVVSPAALMVQYLTGWREMCLLGWQPLRIPAPLQSLV